MSNIKLLLGSISKLYLQFISPNSFTLAIANTTKNWDGILEYSTDKINWIEWNGDISISSASDNINHNLYLRGIGNSIITGSNNGEKRFVISGTNIQCIGNIESLLDYKLVANGEHPIMADNCFLHLFNNCVNLTTAPQLPSNKLSHSCYSGMFFGCTSLTQAPELPALSLAGNCYGEMFAYCSSLITAPALPAKVLQTNCYRGMFAHCSNLETLPALFSTILPNYCYEDMFFECPKIKLSTAKTGQYVNEFRIPYGISIGIEGAGSLYDMFTGTGGIFAGTPNINTTYYTSNQIIEKQKQKLVISIDKNNGFRSVDSLSQSTNSPNELFYGVLPNSGNARVVDVNGQIKQYIQDGIIKNSNLPISIIANGKQVEEHISTDSDYNDLTNTFSMTLGDTLSHWEEMTYQGYAYPDVSKNAFEILYDVLTSIGYTSGEVDEMLSTNIIYGNDNVTGTIKSYLQLITIPYPYLPSDKVKNTIEKFCRLAQLQVYKKDNGNIIFVSARPIATTNELSNSIQIPKKNQYGDLGKSIILKNKYDAVEIDEKKINDTVNYDTTLDNTEDTVSNSSYGDYNYKGSNRQVYASRLKIEGFYTDGTITFNKISSDGLKRIVKFNIDGSPDADGYYLFAKRNNEFTFNTKYRKANGTFTNPNQALTDMNDYSGNDSSLCTFAQNQYSNNVTFQDFEADIYSGKVPNGFIDTVSSTNVEFVDNSYLKVKDNGDTYLIKYHILSQVIIYDVWINYPFGGSSPTGFDSDTSLYKYEASSVSIASYGDLREISFEDISASDKIVTASCIISENITSWEELGSDVDIYRYAFYPSDISQYQDRQKLYFENEEYEINEIDDIDEYFAFPINIHSKLYAKLTNPLTQSITFSSGIIANTIASVQNSELLQENATYKNIKMSTLIKDNIKTDYVNGIATGKMTIPCVDYYDENENKVKNWQNGDIVETHDVIKMPNIDEANWRVTGRTFRKEGVPMIDLELQEIKTN